MVNFGSATVTVMTQEQFMDNNDFVLTVITAFINSVVTIKLLGKCEL